VDGFGVADRKFGIRIGRASLREVRHLAVEPLKRAGEVRRNMLEKRCKVAGDNAIVAVPLVVGDELFESAGVNAKRLHAPARIGWSVVLEIVRQRLSDFLRQWQDPLSARLPGRDTQQSRPPIDIVDFKRYDLGSSEPEMRQQKQDSPVTACRYTCRLGTLQQLCELARREMRREARMLQQPDFRDGAIEPWWNGPAPSQEAQGGPDRARRCPSTVPFLRCRVPSNELSYPFNRQIGPTTLEAGVHEPSDYTRMPNARGCRRANNVAQIPIVADQPRVGSALPVGKGRRILPTRKMVGAVVCGFRRATTGHNPGLGITSPEWVETRAEIMAVVCPRRLRGSGRNAPKARPKGDAQKKFAVLNTVLIFHLERWRYHKPLKLLARPERFELPTPRFVV
jgi:hypothetical protein